MRTENLNLALDEPKRRDHNILVDEGCETEPSLLDQGGGSTRKGNAMFVSDLLQGKKYRTLTISPTEPVTTLAARLFDARVGCMIVSRNGTSLDGIVTERDIVRGLATHAGKIDKLTVADLMTKDVITCSPNDDVSSVAKTMTRRRIRHIPVQDSDRLIGVVSIGDVLKNRLDELELQANVLRDYTIALR